MAGAKFEASESGSDFRCATAPTNVPTKIIATTKQLLLFFPVQFGFVRFRSTQIVLFECQQPTGLIALIIASWELAYHAIIRMYMCNMIKQVAAVNSCWLLGWLTD